MKWIRRNEKNKKKWSKYYEANSILPTVWVFWREETLNMYENESNEILSYNVISFSENLSFRCFHKFYENKFRKSFLYQRQKWIFIPHEIL